MTKAQELFDHATRCDQLAEVCRDAVVAEKLRQLARDYRDLAERQIVRNSSSIDGCFKTCQA